jgi:hypothetical protein
METCVVWFRRDLRLDDNPALVYALQNFSQVIPFFVWACEEEGQVSFVLHPLYLLCSRRVAQPLLLPPHTARVSTEPEPVVALGDRAA